LVKNKKMILLIDTTINPTAIGLWDGKKLQTKTIESNPENNRKIIGIIKKFIEKESGMTSVRMSKKENTLTGVTPEKLTAVGVINGPGTFTGVRTGVVIANTISYALKVPVYSIDTLTAQVPKEINNVVSILSASNTEVFFARFIRGKMIGKIEIVDVVNNLPNRIKKEDLTVGDLQKKHCGSWGSNEFMSVSSLNRIDYLLQMIINNKLKPATQALPLYIKKPNITKKKK